MRPAVPAAFFVSAVLASAVPASAQEHWPQWRGPQHTGVSTSTGLPTTWGPDENIAWKTELPSWSGATPIIWGDRIFIMSPSKAMPTSSFDQPREDPPQQRQGRRGGRRGSGRSPGGEELLLLCLSKSDGAVEWKHTLDRGNALHRKGNNASPSPVTDGTHVWAVTGNGVVTALDMKGNVVWHKNLQEMYGPFGLNWGYASSPLLFEDLLVTEVLHGTHTDDASYVVAFDTMTGDVRWRVERPTDAPMESPDAYTTPIVVDRNGERQIVISGGDVITGHDPKTGEEMWRVHGLNPRSARNYRIVASPLFVDGIVYAPTRVRPLLAVDMTGEEMNDEQILWRWDAGGGPDVPTPTCDGKRFYMVNDAGMVTSVDAKTGDVIWGPERTIAGSVSSSPLLADGRLYFTNEEGVTIVVSAGDAFEMIAANELDGSYSLSSPVVSGKQLFIRTGTHLYCIGQAAE